MSDCFSSPDVAEMAEQLRSNPNNVWAIHAADAIEQLLVENTKLKKERNNAVSDLHRAIEAANVFTGVECFFCKHKNYAAEEKRCPYAKACWNGVCGGWEWYGGVE